MNQKKLLEALDLMATRYIEAREQMIKESKGGDMYQIEDKRKRLIEIAFMLAEDAVNRCVSKK